MTSTIVKNDFNQLLKRYLISYSSFFVRVVRLNVFFQNTIPIINPIDPAKKLLVLDLDKTLFDFSARHKTRSISDVMRPHLISFLTEAYKNYNLAVWSATAWTWVEIKLTGASLEAASFKALN